MEKEKIIGFAALSIAIVGFIFAVGFPFLKSSSLSVGVQNNGVNNNVIPTSQNPGGAYRAVLTGTTEQGDVEITLTPQKVTNGLLQVQISANTHTVDLSTFDLNKLTVLEHDGQKIPPKESPTLSGHHVSGTLTFPFEGKASSFKITIKGIPQSQERVFSWP